MAEGLGVEEFRETTRDTHDFGRRVGQLPEQREGDGKYDYRPLLHRDGSVLSAVTLQVVAPPTCALESRSSINTSRLYIRLTCCYYIIERLTCSIWTSQQNDRADPQLGFSSGACPW